MDKVMNKRKTIVVALLAVVFTFLQVAGWQISMFYNTTVHQSDFLQKTGVLTSIQVVLWSLIELPVMFVILHFLFSLFEKVGQEASKRGDSEAGTQKEKLIAVFKIALPVCLFLCWIPCFLAGYPGFYNYDVNAQVPQVMYDEVSYSAHHPLLHTLFVGHIITLGYRWREILNDGIALHSIIQMLICAVCFSYLIQYICKITGKRIFGILAFCYYAFFPVIPMFAMSTTKDVLFSLLLQICVVLIFEMFINLSDFFASKRKIAIFVVTAVLMCLFRKNGIYIVMAMIPFLFVLCKKYKKKCILLFGMIIFLSLFLDKGLIWVLDAKEGSGEELLSVPMQQVARVYCEQGEEAFDAEELELIYSGISSDDLSNYNPFLSDNIKNYFDYEVIRKNPSAFLTLWLKKGFQYPTEYGKAFLDNTYQAWYPGTSVYSDPDDNSTYYFNMAMRAGGERDSKAPKLLKFYEKIASEYYYQKIPVVRLLFSIGAMFWVALFTWSFAVYQKNKPLYLAMLPVLLCCATVFLGPISLVRYYLVLFYGFPVSVGFLCAGKKEI